MKHLAAIALLTTLFAPVAHAAETEWIEIGPEARIRLISSGETTTGEANAAIEVEMPEAFKTYWRIPGETGIPLVLDTSGARNVDSVEILWPYPTPERTGGFVDYTYHGHVTLPLIVQGGPDAELVAEIVMGICEEICIPVRAQFDLALADGGPDRANALRIRQASAEVPLIWTDAAEPVGEPVYDPAARTMRVPIDPQLINPGSVIIDTADPAQLFGLPKKSPEGDILEFAYLGSRGEPAATLNITFMTADGPYTLRKTVTLAPQ